MMEHIPYLVAAFSLGMITDATAIRLRQMRRAKRTKQR